MTDVVVRLVECGEYEGRVHHGFSSVLRRTWGKVESLLSFIALPSTLTGDLPCSAVRLDRPLRFSPISAWRAQQTGGRQGDLRNAVAGSYGAALISVSQPWMGLTQSFEPRPPSA